jgi:hypothetical protein
MLPMTPAALEEATEAPEAPEPDDADRGRVM